MYCNCIIHVRCMCLFVRCVHDGIGCLCNCRCFIFFFLHKFGIYICSQIVCAFASVRGECVCHTYQKSLCDIFFLLFNKIHCYQTTSGLSESLLSKWLWLLLCYWTFSIHMNYENWAMVFSIFLYNSHFYAFHDVDDVIIFP